jgi:alpha-beta hydrolase superfamily lysophospholipase
MEDGGMVNALHFRVPNSKGVVFYIKGNSRSIKGWGKFAKDFVGKGFDFFILDFRGFGKSHGRRTEEILFSDLQHVYKWLSDEYGEARIVLYGRSLGSGLAARVASWNRPQMVVSRLPLLLLLVPHLPLRVSSCPFAGYCAIIFARTGLLKRYAVQYISLGVPKIASSHTAKVRDAQSPSS